MMPLIPLIGSVDENDDQVRDRQTKLYVRTGMISGGDPSGHDTSDN